MLRKRLGEFEAGTFAGPQVERIKVQELSEDFIRDYRINGRKSLDDVQARWTSTWSRSLPICGPQT